MYKLVLFFLILQKIPALCTVIWYLITLYLFLRWSSSFFTFQLFITSSFTTSNPVGFFLSNLCNSSSCDMYSFVHNFHLDTFSIFCNNSSNCYLISCPPFPFTLYENCPSEKLLGPRWTPTAYVSSNPENNFVQAPQIF